MTAGYAAIAAMVAAGFAHGWLERRRSRRLGHRLDLGGHRQRYHTGPIPGGDR